MTKDIIAFRRCKGPKLTHSHSHQYGFNDFDDIAALQLLIRLSVQSNAVKNLKHPTCNIIKTLKLQLKLVTYHKITIFYIVNGTYSR